METVFRTHCPASDDIIQLLVSLFSTEERHRILTKARKWLRAMAPEGTANPLRWAEPSTLTRGPVGTVTQRREGPPRDIPGGYFTRSQEGARKPMGMAKPSEVIQRESELPSEVYKRLCEAYRPSQRLLGLRW